MRTHYTMLLPYKKKSSYPSDADLWGCFYDAHDSPSNEQYVKLTFMKVGQYIY